MYDDDDYLGMQPLCFGDVYDTGYGMALADAHRMQHPDDEDRFNLAEEISYETEGWR